MKTAIYIEDGRTQVVLTPESKTDEAVLDKISPHGHGMLPENPPLAMYRGGFYDCLGGWTRHAANERSLIIVVNEPSRQTDAATLPTPEPTP